ncbi:hypothetical protein GCM10009715_24130 [Paeniglutamicibacter psychrophenolicus]
MPGVCDKEWAEAIPWGSAGALWVKSDKCCVPERGPAADSRAVFTERVSTCHGRGYPRGILRAPKGGGAAGRKGEESGRETGRSCAAPSAWRRWVRLVPVGR